MAKKLGKNNNSSRITKWLEERTSCKANQENLMWLRG